MTTIAHLSDFHFGTEIPEITNALIADVQALRPTLVAFSGDHTQRALEHQYKAASEYFALLPKPLVAIPGNHDFPLYNPIARALAPLQGYKKYISKEIEPSYNDEHIALVSINTSRHYFWKDGIVSNKQLDRMKMEFSAVPATACRIVMMHHPCFVPPEFPKHNKVDRADEALAAMSHARVELVLAGHMHDAFVILTDPEPPHRPVHLVLSQAGTAISDRRRSQPNSYNIVRIQDHEITIVIRAWNGSAFADAETRRFTRHWKRPPTQE
ncbi:MAG: metallophosphoesterase [bacterium]|nr:metallophosphoesterase [bacterium]